MNGVVSRFNSIKKRDGRLVPFVPEKIALAISKAGHATGEFGPDVAEKLTAKVIRRASTALGENVVDVETIQDFVENILLESPHRQTAKAYILYRDHRAQIRSVSDTGLETMKQYLNSEVWEVKENSNMPFSLQGMNCYVSAAVSKHYWLNQVYSDKIRQAHVNGDMHIHDLNLLAVYCVGWDLMDILRVGFKGVSGNIESSPPKHLQTATGQLYNFFYSLQGESAGAQAISNFDTLLAPFIRYDNLSYDEVYQIMQGLIFNLNVPTRVGFQTPFTNISFDLTVPSYLRDTPVLIGGQHQDEVYGDFQNEMDMLNRAFAEVMMAGDNKGRIFTFPIPTYSITKDFNWDNPVLDPIWRMTGRYGIPYFSNYVNSDMKPEDARSMCCHLRLDNRELKKRGGGLFGANPLTGSVGVVTLNLPRIGYLAVSKEDLFRRLGNLADLACESLVLKRKTLEHFSESGLYPYSRFYLRDIKERTKRYWANHFSTIGVVGANEACLNFLGQDISTPEGKELALEILNFLRNKLTDYQEKTEDLFNLEATPAEGTSYRLALMDQKRYDDMIFANGRAQDHKSEKAPFRPFYTNSTLLPVDHTTDLFDALEHQDDLQSSYTGGTVLHSFIGEQITDSEVVKSLIKKIASNYKLPYFTLTPTFSVCAKDGYLVGEQHTCPRCSEPTDVYSRVVGYFRPVARWNDGKQAEFKQRTTYAGLNNMQGETLRTGHALSEKKNIL
ncbi:MAG: ribonucleoside triphosphate reductase [Deltaproteobacteria bacterium]|jgi:ribonucleoside-triphosphate reductase|nr:ribonucleoside triphosphate reductase [Deltaproteobacteria bacterium]